MTAIILAIIGALGVVGRFWWGRRKAESRARDAEVRADLAQAEADRHRLQAEADRAVRDRQAAARTDEREVVAAGTEAAQAGDPHPDRVAAVARGRRQTDAASRVRRAIKRGGK